MRQTVMTVTRPIVFVAILVCAVLSTKIASAVEATSSLKQAHINLDKKTINKGLQVFTDVCMGCHSARYLTYHDLMDYPMFGLTRKEAQDLSGGQPLTAAMMSSLPPEAAKQSFGVAPPDLSIIAKAREG
ncbi:MAG TPA: cytochrome c1, partial [Mariprofundaceae bacterium]|nr:cytochrome c1 [Mariprofundaceae bacterium]